MQSPANSISLNRQLRFLFDKGRFTLKPLCQTDNTITVQFHWLSRRSWIVSPGSAVVSNYSDPFQQWYDKGTPWTSWGSGLAHRSSGVPIRTGDTFVIRAAKPDEFPSLALLELQWNLHWMAAICGAPDMLEEEDDDDNER